MASFFAASSAIYLEGFGDAVGGDFELLSVVGCY